MSLSKYFKNSDSFQQEDILKIKDPESRGWKSAVVDVPSVPFQAEKPIENVSNDTTVYSNSSNTAKQQPDETELTDLAPPHANENPAIAENEAEELSQYIEISVAEKKIQEAYDSGVRSGLEKAENDFGSATNSLITICKQLDTVRETIIANSSREMQEFALAVAERIIRSSIRENDSTVVATIDEALQRAVKSEEFYIYINPDDYEIVLEKSDELIAGLSGLNNIVIKKDVTIEKGGAKIESDNCTIDATIASQFDVIREEMKKRM